MSNGTGLGVDPTEETIFTWGAPPLKFGAGAVDEIGFEMAQYGARRVLILTDPRINELGIPARIGQGLPAAGLPAARAEQLPAAVIALMRDIDIPNGIGAVGYTEADIPDLVPGTMKQQRLLATCPRPVSEDDIAAIFAKSIQNW
jgi:alcohol dehydrogenase class IV